MAKQLPYFQFEPAQYLAGNIQFCSFEEQGIFINICALYWQRSCRATKDQLIRKFGSSHIHRLIVEGVIECESEDVSIKFLDEQWRTITNSKLRLSEAGKKGADIKKQATLKPPLSDATQTLKQPDKIREEEKREDVLPNTNVLGNSESATADSPTAPDSDKIPTTTNKAMALYNQLIKTTDLTGAIVVDFIKTHNPKYYRPYVDLWNFFAVKNGCAQVATVSDGRKRKIGSRLNEKEFDFIAILTAASKQKFALEGKWFNFDWIIENDTNYLKVLEMKYMKAEGIKSDDKLKTVEYAN